MRHLMLSLFVVSLLFSMAGCHTSHGVCDCVIDDHCSSRSPWIRLGGPVPESIPAPMVLPEVKNKL